MKRPNWFLVLFFCLFSIAGLSKASFYDPFSLDVRPSSILSSDWYDLVITAKEKVQGCFGDRAIKKMTILLPFHRNHLNYMNIVIESAKHGHRKVGLDYLLLQNKGHTALGKYLRNLDHYLFLSEQPLNHTIKHFEPDQVTFIERTKTGESIYRIINNCYRLTREQSTVLEELRSHKQENIKISLNLTVLAKPEVFHQYFMPHDVVKSVPARD